MAYERTCGEGLAENAVLPGKLAKLAEALADNLDAHMKTLEIADEAARAEHDTYARLVRELRSAADELETAAEAMAAARDEPMGKHHDAGAPSAEALEAFGMLVRVKRELAELLARSADSDQRTLVQMTAAAARQSKASS